MPVHAAAVQLDVQQGTATYCYARAGEVEAGKKKGKETGEKRERMHSLAGCGPVGIVEATMNSDHQKEAVPQPPEEEEEGHCKLMPANEAHIQCL